MLSGQREAMRAEGAMDAKKLTNAQLIHKVERRARRAAIWSVGLPIRIRLNKNTLRAGRITSAKFIGFRARKHSMIAQFMVTLGTKSKRTYVVEQLPQ